LQDQQSRLGLDEDLLLKCLEFCIEEIEEAGYGPVFSREDYIGIVKIREKLIGIPEAKHECNNPGCPVCRGFPPQGRTL
jgi:hypothetical protein